MPLVVQRRKRRGSCDWAVARCGRTVVFLTPYLTRAACAGSALHALRALQHPRWEDFDYERKDAVDNRMYWLGDGQTWNEKTLTGDSMSSVLIRFVVSDVPFRGMVLGRGDH